MLFKNLKFLVPSLLVSVFFCQGITFSAHSYEGTDDIFPNPERGFSSFRTTPLTLSYCLGLRNQDMTLIQRIHTMPQFNSGPISQSYLDMIENDCLIAREAGVKMFMRFSYTSNQGGADAPLQVILDQLDQLEPVFQEYYDVITYIEAGFIGAWGEWYYSSNNLNNTEDRRAVLYKILDVLPEKRTAVVRTPNYKRLIFENDNPLTELQAFNGTKRARTGAHNDCFLSSYDDYGTYVDVEGDKDYLNLDNRYVPQGGETCNPSEYSGCENALIDMERLHYSQLNSGYNMNVLNGWVAEGCMPEVKRRLGYRFRLISSFIQDNAKPDGTFEMDLEIANDGFASPFNPRLLEIVLRNIDTDSLFYLVSAQDPRWWMGGDTVNVTIYGGFLPDMPEGDYQVMLNMPDPEPGLHFRSEYAIRLANEGLWEDETGFNDLQHIITIDAGTIGLPFAGDSFFVPASDLDLGEEILPGDMNNDEILDVLDIVMMIDIILENIIPTQYQLEAGDANGDGGIDVLDIVYVVSVILDSGALLLERADDLSEPYLHAISKT
ncbi:MAG: DUF4832 domain-containing protein [FCB group bacterium]|nr:DUF4832 domain-containing protein [FCB group bacterium]